MSDKQIKEPFLAIDIENSSDKQLQLGDKEYYPMIDLTEHVTDQSKEYMDQFLNGCKDGNIKVVMDSIKIAEAKNELTMMMGKVAENRYTGLHYAVEIKHYEIAKLCLEKGAQVDAITERESRTALFFAVHRGNMELVELLTFYGAQINAKDTYDMTATHMAASKKNSKILEYLIKNGADIESRDDELQTPLLTASKFGQVESIKLLMDHNCDLSVVDNEGKSALFTSVELDHIDSVKILLSGKNASVLTTIPNKTGNLPLHVANKQGQDDIIKILLDSGAIDDVKNNKGQTPMHVAAKYGKASSIKILQKHSKKSLFHETDKNLDTPLHLAAKAGHSNVISLLLDLGADIRAKNERQRTPLHLATESGHLVASKALLDRKASPNEPDKNQVTPLHLACKSGEHKLVTLLIEAGANVRTRSLDDEDGILKASNPLDVAIDNENRECVQAMIDCDDWKVALRNQTRSSTGSVDTPLRKLIRSMPDIAVKVFDKCTKTNKKNQDDQNYEITYNFEFIEDSFANWYQRTLYGDNASDALPPKIYKDNGRLTELTQMYSADRKQLKENHPLMVMVDYNREDLLSHPLVSTLLNKKWNTFGQALYIINLAIYISFLTPLLIYMVQAVPPYQYYLRNKTRSLNESTCAHVQRTFSGERLGRHAYICKYLVLIIGSFCLVKEIIQFFMNMRQYFNIENTIEVVLYILAFLTVLDVSACQQKLGIREAWQWQTGTIAAFLGVINMVLFIQKLPFFGIYIVMFINVMRTFLKFLPLLTLFIFIFAFAFYILLSNQIAFHNLGNSMFRTTVMMVGEFEFDETFNAQWQENPVDNKRIFYNGVTYIIFIVFILMMSIITMNLLVGLAVDDIKAIQKKATLRRQSMKVTLVLEIESILHVNLRRRFIKRKAIVSPNKRWAIYRLLFGDQPRTKKTADKNMDQMNAMARQLEKTKNDVSDIKEKFDVLNGHCASTTKLLNEILKSLRLDVNEVIP